MKKSIMLLAAGFGLMTFASCSNDDAPVGNTDGRVTFTVELPADMVTRAADEPGDGLSATTLHYAVYEKVSNKLLIKDGTPGYPAPTFSELKTTLTLQLADNVNYDIVFYATSANPAYVYDYENQSISIPTTDTPLANQEGYDAFYATVQDFTTTKGDQDVKLTRPFAQINVGTNDLDNPTVGKLTTSSVTVTNAPTTLNLMTGVATGSQPVKFEASPVLSSTEYSFPVSGYEYVAMAYVLAGGDQDHSPSNTYTVEVTTNGNTTSFDWTNVPLRTNYRTNIYGSLFTSNTNFNIEIVPAWGGEDNDIEIIPPVIATPTNLTTIKSSIQNNGTVKLKGNFTAGQTLQLPIGYNVVVDGTEATFGNQFKIMTFNADSSSALEGDRAGIIVVKNIKGETSLSMAVSKATLTVKDCEIASFDIWGGNLAITIDNVKVDGQNQVWKRFDGNDGGYGMYLDLAGYDLVATDNVIKGVVKNCFGINGREEDLAQPGGYCVANLVKTFSGNTLFVGSKTSDGRCGFKVWDDVTYAPRADHASLNAAAQGLRDLIKSSNNTFDVNPGAQLPIYEMDFFGVTVNKMTVN